jgi:hypothetical protein
LVAYDWGFKKPIAGTCIMSLWQETLQRSIATGTPRLIDALNPKPVGNTFGSYYTDRIETANPGYLTWLFRQAQKKDGNKGMWKEYAKSMTILSGVPDDPRPQLKLTKGQVRRWSIAHKGKCKRVVTCPILTESHKEQRVRWCSAMRQANDEHCLYLQSSEQRQKRVFKAGPPYRCFEDEKFFYTSSGRRKVKELPHQEG